MNALNVSNRTDLNEIMNDWVNQIPAATGVVLVTADGLLSAHSSNALPVDAAQRLAAAMSGLRGCAAGIGEIAEIGAPSVAVLEMTAGWAVVTSAAAGTLLGVITTRQASPAEVADHMRVMASRITEHLTTAPRTTAAPGAV